jgi:hypothetical protein
MERHKQEDWDVVLLLRTHPSCRHGLGDLCFAIQLKSIIFSGQNILQKVFTSYVQAHKDMVMDVSARNMPRRLDEFGQTDERGIMHVSSNASYDVCLDWRVARRLTGASVSIASYYRAERKVQIHCSYLHQLDGRSSGVAKHRRTILQKDNYRTHIAATTGEVCPCIEIFVASITRSLDAGSGIKRLPASPRQDACLAGAYQTTIGLSRNSSASQTPG